MQRRRAPAGRRPRQARARAGTSRRSALAAAGSATTIPASITAHPAAPAGPRRSSASHTPKKRGERRLEREHERSPGSGRARLHPRRDEVPERAGKDSRDHECAPDGPAAWRLELTRRGRDGGEAEAAHRHLQKGQRARVVAGSEALHRRDLQRLRKRVAEHERVADGRAAGCAVQEQQADHGQRDSEPEDARHRGAEERECQQRREDDVQPGDEAGAGDGRQLEPCRLQAVGRGKEHARAAAGEEPRPRHRPQGPPGERGEHCGGDGEANGEEGEQRVEADRLLHGHERVAPDRRDSDQRDEWRGRAAAHPGNLLGWVSPSALPHAVPP